MELPFEETDDDDGLVDGVRDDGPVLAPLMVLLVDGDMDDHLVVAALRGVDDDDDVVDGDRDDGLISATFVRLGVDGDTDVKLVEATPIEG